MGILVVFHCGRLPLWSSSILVVFHFGRLPFWSSSILVVFHFGHLPFWSLPFWSSPILVVFHFGRLPFWSYPPTQLNGPILPHSSTVVYSGATSLCGQILNYKKQLTTHPPTHTLT